MTLFVLITLIMLGTKMLGYQMLTVDSESMEPNFPKDSLIFVKSVDPSTLQKDDVITFTIDENGTLVTHRIFFSKPEERYFITKGDANDMYDGSPVSWSNVVGKVDFSLPKVGAITKVTIPGTVTEVGVGTFSKTPNLTEVRVSKNLTNIWGSAFKGSGLTTVTIPAGVKTLTDSCFADTPDLATVNMTEGLEEIGNNVFSGCTSLTTVFLPEGLTKLSGAVFNGCTSLESVTIPASVTDFGESFNFDGCDLTKLTIKGEAGSAAQTYAVNNGISFEAI